MDLSRRHEVQRPALGRLLRRESPESPRLGCLPRRLEVVHRFGNVSLVAAVSKDLTARVKAGELVKKLSAMVGGGGGGRADFAQAGGKEPEKLPDVLASVGEAVREQLGR